MKNKLLEKAHSYRGKNTTLNASDDMMELALEWAQDKISMTQASVAINGEFKSPNPYAHLARGLRKAIETGRLILKK